MRILTSKVDNLNRDVVYYILYPFYDNGADSYIYYSPKSRRWIRHDFPNSDTDWKTFTLHTSEFKMRNIINSQIKLNYYANGSGKIVEYDTLEELLIMRELGR